MKLADILVLESAIPPYEIASKPSRVTLSFLSSLLNDSGFCKEFESVREEYGIRKPISLDAFTVQADDVYAFYDFMQESFDEIMFRYGLPNGFRFQLFLLVVFQAFIDIPEDAEPDIAYLSDPSEIADSIKNLEDEKRRMSALMFESACTKKELFQWIDKNWDYIKKEMEVKLPARPKLGKVYKNVAIAQEIYELFTSGKTYEQVSDILMSKYPDNSFVCDVAWLKTVASRHLSKSKKFTRKFPPLESFLD